MNETHQGTEMLQMGGEKSEKNVLRKGWIVGLADRCAAVLGWEHVPEVCGYPLIYLLEGRPGDALSHVELGVCVLQVLLLLSDEIK